MDHIKNEEKSDGLFDLMHDRLTPEQIEESRALQMDSWNQACPKYVGVIFTPMNF